MTYASCENGPTQAGKGIIAVHVACRQWIFVNRCCIAGIYASNAFRSEEAVTITPQDDGQREERFEDQHPNGEG